MAEQELTHILFTLKVTLVRVTLISHGKNPRNTHHYMASSRFKVRRLSFLFHQKETRFSNVCLSPRNERQSPLPWRSEELLRVFHQIHWSRIHRYIYVTGRQSNVKKTSCMDDLYSLPTYQSPCLLISRTDVGFCCLWCRLACSKSVRHVSFSLTRLIGIQRHCSPISTLCCFHGNRGVIRGRQLKMCLYHR